MKSLIIEVDAYKLEVPGYDPKKSWKYHKQSAKLADVVFKQALKNAQYKKVVLMCGGSASGKSEFVSSNLIDKGVIVYDGTLSSIEGAKVKIRNSKRKRKNVEINAIIPDNITKVFRAFLARDRTIPIDVFIETHSLCRSTLLWILEHQMDIDVKIYESSVKKDKLRVDELIFGDRNDMTKYVKLIQISKQEIRKLIQLQP